MAISFKSVDEQIEILEKRGLKVENRTKAKKLLLRSNYYDVVNGYSSFIQQSSDKYKEGATFDELYAIYAFDKRLKVVIFEYLAQSEAFLRTAVAYYFSKNYGADYLSSQNFIAKKAPKLLGKIQKLIDFQNSKKSTNAIKHYSKKYQEIPLWVLVNFFDFGHLNLFFGGLLPRDKAEILNYIADLYKEEYGKTLELLPSDFEIYLINIKEIRNKVVHDNLLLKYSLIKEFPENKNLAFPFNDLKTNTVFYTLLTMRLFLSKKQYTIFVNTIKNRVKSLERCLKTGDSKEILGSIGFPENWFELLTETQDN